MPTQTIAQDPGAVKSIVPYPLSVSTQGVPGGFHAGGEETRELSKHLVVRLPEQGQSVKKSRPAPLFTCK